MSNKCGGCLLFKGPSQKCEAGKHVGSATQSAPSSCFKGPASLFKSKVCGACRLFKGSSQKCSAGKHVGSATQSAPSSCFSPNPG